MLRKSKKIYSYIHATTNNNLQVRKVPINDKHTWLFILNFNVTVIFIVLKINEADRICKLFLIKRMFFTCIIPICNDGITDIRINVAFQPS